MSARASLPVAPAARALFASHDAASLAGYLRRETRAPVSSCEAAAARALRHVHRDEGALRDDALREAGVGAWAIPALVALDAESSLRLVEIAPSSDDTLRLALAARDGALIESVIIPGPRRTTLCMSSQVGCARACSFCETGRHGYKRQLSAGEIVDQLRVARAVMRGEGRLGDARPPLQNIVLMGMGEPLDNLAEVARATRLLTDPRAYAIARSRLTVSTVGVADKIEPFFRECSAELAVSLNAPDDARRSAIMPINDRTPLAALLDTIARALPKGRRVLFEYVLFDRVNDAPEDAALLAALVAPIPCRVNVIPANPGPDPSLRPPDPTRAAAFVAALSERGVTTLVRVPKGRDVGGACGQLAGAVRGVARAAE